MDCRNPDHKDVKYNKAYFSYSGHYIFDVAIPGLWISAIHAEMTGFFKVHLVSPFYSKSTHHAPQLPNLPSSLGLCHNAFYF
jgi:hypothetical protein